MSDYTIKTKEIRKICKAAKANKKGKKMLKQFIQSIPVSSNYRFEHFEDDASKFGLLGVKSKFKKSNSPLLEHIQIVNLTSECKVKLDDKQKKLLGMLQSLK